MAKEIHLRQVAEACGSYYKLIRRLNPRLRTATLPPGMYKLYVPAGTASRFYEAYLRGRLGGGKNEPWRSACRSQPKTKEEIMVSANEPVFNR